MTPEHLTCLTSVLWRDPEERKAVERLVSQAACPIYLVALEAEDPMADIVNSLPEPGALNYDDAVENALVQISDLQRTSRALEAPEREGRRYVAWPM